MADVPNGGASNLQNIQHIPPRIDPSAVEDIDRELDAYLEEKRRGYSLGKETSVDSQLSKLREKFGQYGRPTKESEKPAEVQVVEKTTTDKVAPSNTPVPPTQGGARQAQATKKTTSQQETRSHEDIIRSLEEKYSTPPEKGESQTKPQNPVVQTEKKEVSEAPVNKPPQQQKSHKEVSRVNVPRPQEGVREVRQSEPKKVERRNILSELRASIASHDAGRLEELLGDFAQLPHEKQQNIAGEFLSQFARNKERKELYEKVQADLESAFSELVKKSAIPQKKKPVQNSDITHSPTPDKDEFFGKIAPKLIKKVDNKNEGATSVPQKETEQNQAPANKEFDILNSQKHGAPPRDFQEVSDDQFPTPQKTLEVERVAVENDTDAPLRKKYAEYFESVEKKPTVLMYNPAQGFIRKDVDPSDTDLVLQYSPLGEGVVVRVYDTQGNDLGSVEVA